MKKPAIFLDRDGTLCEEVNYLSRPEDLRLFSFAAQSIKLLKEKGFLVILITNQSGIGRGYFTQETLFEIHEKLVKELAEKGAKPDAIYFCPHISEDFCDCRKPKAGMIEQAANDFEIDLENSWMIGDKVADVNAGINAKTKTCLVLTGYGSKEVEKLEIQPDLIAENLMIAVEKLVNVNF